VKVTDRIPSNDFQRLIAAIQEGSEREIERAVVTIARAVGSTTRRKPATHKVSSK
jgi:hypothetical protein